MTSCQDILRQHFPEFRDRVYSPTTPLFAFLSQMLSADRSCSETVARVNAERVAQGLAPASANHSAYVKARERIPEPFLYELTTHTGQAMGQRTHGLALAGSTCQACGWIDLDHGRYTRKSGCLWPNLVSGTRAGIPHFSHAGYLFSGNRICTGFCQWAIPGETNRGTCTSSSAFALL